MSDGIVFLEADDHLWQEYDLLATRSYGHRVGDVTSLRAHADARVALRDGKVVAGGLGLLLPQYFGGQPVPSACLGDGCVAPEERGDRLGRQMTAERLRPLRAQGAVISTVWTSSSAYARSLGWEAPVPVFAWEVAADDLKRSFPAEDYVVAHGPASQAEDLQRALARQWNGPVSRPSWWAAWKEAKNSLTVYRFGEPGGGPTVGLLTFRMSPKQPRGMDLVVHDFWAADESAAAAMMAFLGRHNSRAETIQFRRAALPPYPSLLHNLHRHRLTAQAWHPWMLRVLDAAEAVRLRGWPTDVTVSVPVEIENDSRDGWERFHLAISDGEADLRPGSAEAEVRLTRRQLAVWYAGGYRSAASARLAGVRATSDPALTGLVRSTTDLEPWLPDHF